ncbi:MAG: hypothetical protein LBR23_02730 [Spirochaetaceae bacterium]|jgi:hypothetical protein|nr:hypothetical protein [Spirochaetaceae bacterium]
MTETAKKLAAAALAMGILTSLFGLEVDRTELQTVETEDIVFINYSGPYGVVNTAEEINGIGRALGERIQQNAQAAGSPARYQILHVPGDGGLGADVLVLGENAGVDHIRNLRRIIASYLSAAYGYAPQDASALAVFVTVYNAVYRGNVNYFAGKYVPAVVGLLSPQKAGLALSYREWPGNTQIVIPISDPQSAVSPVDTSLISDRKVIESLREEDDRGIGDRKQMVDLKEREADAAQERADIARERADGEKQKQQDEEAKLQEKQEEAQQARKDAEEAQAAAQESPQDKEAAAKAGEAEAGAAQKEAEAREQERAAEQQREKAAEAQKEADDAQKTADSKREEAKAERDAIAGDQAALMGKEKEAPEPAGVFGLRLVDPGNLLSAVVRVNPGTGKPIRESPVRVIRSRTIFQGADGVVAIAGENTGNGAIKLVLLDPVNLEILRESAEILGANSVLASDGTAYYAVIQNGGAWALGKYDSQMKLLARSGVAVNPDTPVVVTKSGVSVTASDGTVRLLKQGDLTEIK